MDSPKTRPLEERLSEVEIDYTFENIRWEKVPERYLIGDTVTIVGGYDEFGGKHIEVDASNIQALGVFVDAGTDLNNTIYITEKGVFVLEYGGVSTDDFKSQAELTIENFSMDGIIEYVEPKAGDAVPPLELIDMRLNELKEDDKIVAFDKEPKDGDINITIIVNETSPGRKDLLNVCRNIRGVTYPKPDQLTLVNPWKDLDESHDDTLLQQRILMTLHDTLETKPHLTSVDVDALVQNLDASRETVDVNLWTLAERGSISIESVDFDRLVCDSVSLTAEGESTLDIDRPFFETDRPIRSTPAVINDTVVVGSADGTVYALTKRDGEQRWKFDAGGPVFSSPEIKDDSIFVGSENSYLYALNHASGAERWRFEAMGALTASPALAEGTVIVGDRIRYTGGNVYGVNADTGEQYWQFETGDQIHAAPTVANGAVFVGSSDGNVYALDVNTGEQRWVVETGDLTTQIWSSPTVDGETVYVGSDDGYLYALEAETGVQRWRFETGDRVRSSPTVNDGTVFVGSNDSRLYAIETTTGRESWYFETEGSVRTKPAVSVDTVFIGSDDNNIYALEMASGQLRWAVETGDSVRSSPTVDGETLFVGSDDGTLYNLNTATGESNRGRSRNQDIDSQNDQQASSSLSEVDLEDTQDRRSNNPRAEEFAIDTIKNKGEIPIRELIEAVYEHHPEGFQSPSELYTGFLNESLEQIPYIERDSNNKMWRYTDRETVSITARVEELSLSDTEQNPERQRTAIQFAYDLIRDEQSISIRDLIDQTYAEYSAGYDSPSTFYQSCLRQALRDLADSDPKLDYNRSENLWEYSD
jgi:outer membrane protein assembly factor BamB